MSKADMQAWIERLAIEKSALEKRVREAETNRQVAHVLLAERDFRMEDDRGITRGHGSLRFQAIPQKPLSYLANVERFEIHANGGSGFREVFACTQLEEAVAKFNELCSNPPRPDQDPYEWVQSIKAQNDIIIQPLPTPTTEAAHE